MTELLAVAARGLDMLVDRLYKEQQGAEGTLVERCQELFQSMLDDKDGVFEQYRKLINQEIGKIMENTNDPSPNYRYLRLVSGYAPVNGIFGTTQNQALPPVTTTGYLTPPYPAFKGKGKFFCLFLDCGYTSDSVQITRKRYDTDKNLLNTTNIMSCPIANGGGSPKVSNSPGVMPAPVGSCANSFSNVPGSQYTEAYGFICLPIFEEYNQDDCKYTRFTFDNNYTRMGVNHWVAFSILMETEEDTNWTDTVAV